MGYPQTAQVNAPIVQESVTAVLNHALNQLDEVEKKLQQLRDRLDMRSGAEQKIQSPPVAGVLNSALAVRNSAARLMDLCAQFDALL